MGARNAPRVAPRTSPPSERSQLGEGRTSVVRWPDDEEKTCSRSAVCGDALAGRLGGGSWDTNVVRTASVKSVHSSIVGEVRRAVTLEKVASSAV